MNTNNFFGFTNLKKKEEKKKTTEDETNKVCKVR